MKHEDELSRSSNLTDGDVRAFQATRRDLLGVGAIAAGELIVAGSATLYFMAPAAAATAPSANTDKLMTASKLLIQHQLSPIVGARIAGLLSAAIPSLDVDLTQIIQTAKTKSAHVVEDFFDALPEGQAKDTAHRIIFAWYAGVIDESPTAEVFAYEEALMYQPTRDAIALPSYSFTGPDHWTAINPPLSAMPEF